VSGFAKDAVIEELRKNKCHQENYDDPQQG